MGLDDHSLALEMEAKDMMILNSKENEGTVIEAVSFLTHFIEPVIKDLIREATEKDPEGWWINYHFGWGMGIRNALRQSGFGERELNASNMDNVYVELVERAVKLLESTNETQTG